MFNVNTVFVFLSPEISEKIEGDNLREESSQENMQYASTTAKTVIYEFIELCTPPNSEIICGQNVDTKVVCGIIFFFEKKAMLKI